MQLLDVETALTQVKEHMSGGRNEDAAIVLVAAATREPDVAPALVQLGTTEYQRGDDDAAVTHLQRALEIAPGLVDPKLLLARIAMRQGRIDDACSIAAEIELAAPGNSRALSTAAKAYAKGRRFPDAVRAWRKVATLTPDDSVAWAEIARNELRSKSPEAALEAAEQSIALNAGSATAHSVRIEALKRLRRFADLAAAALSAAAVEPGAAASAIPLLQKSSLLAAAEIAAAVRKAGGYIPEDKAEDLARDLLRKGRAETAEDPEAAIVTWRTLLILDPDNRQAQSAIRKYAAPILASARAKAAAGDIAGAITDNQTLLELGGNRTRILRDLASLYERASNWAEGARYRAAFAEAEGSRDGFSRAARNATKAGMLIEALEYYRSAYGNEIGSDEAQASIHTVKVRLQRDMRDHFDGGRLDDTARVAQVILTTDPENEAAASMLRKVAGRFVRLIRKAIDLADVEVQEELSKSLIAIDPKHTVALRTLLRIYAVQKRRGECLEVLDRLVEIEPDDSGHWEKKARICRSMRKYDQGIPAALRALELDPGNRNIVGYLNDMLGRQAAAA